MESQSRTPLLGIDRQRLVPADHHSGHDNSGDLTCRAIPGESGVHRAATGAHDKQDGVHQSQGKLNICSRKTCRMLIKSIVL